MYRIIAIRLPSAGAICCYHFRAICHAIILNLSASHVASLISLLGEISITIIRYPLVYIFLKEKELFILFS